LPLTVSAPATLHRNWAESVVDPQASWKPPGPKKRCCRTTNNPFSRVPVQPSQPCASGPLHVTRSGAVPGAAITSDDDPLSVSAPSASCTLPAEAAPISAVMSARTTRSVADNVGDVELSVQAAKATTSVAIAARLSMERVMGNSVERGKVED